MGEIHCRSLKQYLVRVIWAQISALSRSTSDLYQYRRTIKASDVYKIMHAPFPINIRWEKMLPEIFPHFLARITQALRTHGTFIELRSHGY